MSKPDRRDYPAFVRAMGDEVISVETVRARLNLTYSQAYERIKALVKAEQVRVVQRAVGGRVALYQLCVPANSAIDVMAAPVEPVDPWSSCELERAWPMPVVSPWARH